MKLLALTPTVKTLQASPPSKFTFCVSLSRARVPSRRGLWP